MNSILNNMITPQVYFLIWLVITSASLSYFYKKYERVFIDHLVICIVFGAIWMVSIPALLIWGVNCKINKYFF